LSMQLWPARGCHLRPRSCHIERGERARELVRPVRVIAAQAVEVLLRRPLLLVGAARQGREGRPCAGLQASARARDTLVTAFSPNLRSSLGV
jgi:hypothetical protein